MSLSFWRNEYRYGTAFLTDSAKRLEFAAQQIKPDTKCIHEINNLNCDNLLIPPSVYMCACDFTLKISPFLPPLYNSVSSYIRVVNDIVWWMNPTF